MEQGLQPGKVPNQLEQPLHPHHPDLFLFLHKPQHSHHPDQPDDLPRLPDDLVVLQTLKKDGDVEGDDGGEVHNVQRVLEEPQLVGADNQAEEILNGEEDHNEAVNELDGEGNVGILYVAVLVLLQLLHCGEDEGDG